MYRQKTLGQLIKEKVKEANLTVEEFAEAIHSNRASVYGKIYKCDYQCNIDVGVIMRISKILKYNFFEEICRQMNKEKDVQKFLVLIETSKQGYQDLVAQKVNIIYSNPVPKFY
jgi:transcriptional regulator with XRE-family HTH domain